MTLDELRTVKIALRNLSVKLRLQESLTGSDNAVLIKVLNDDLDIGLHISELGKFIQDHTVILAIIKEHVEKHTDSSLHILLRHCESNGKTQSRALNWFPDTNIAQLAAHGKPFHNGLKESPKKKSSIATDKDKTTGKRQPLTTNPEEVQEWVTTLQAYSAATIQSPQAIEIFGISHDRKEEGYRIAAQRIKTGQQSTKLLQRAAFFDDISNSQFTNSTDKDLESKIDDLCEAITTRTAPQHQILLKIAFDKFKQIHPYLTQKNPTSPSPYAASSSHQTNTSHDVPFFLRYLNEDARASTSAAYDRYSKIDLFAEKFATPLESEGYVGGLGIGDLKLLLTVWLYAKKYKKPAILLSCNAALIPQLLSRPALLSLLCTEDNFYFIIPGAITISANEFVRILGLYYDRTSTAMTINTDKKFKSDFFATLSVQKQRTIMRQTDQYVKNLIDMPKREVDLTQIGLGQYEQSIKNLPQLFNPDNKDLRLNEKRQSFFVNQANGLEILFIYHQIISVPSLNLIAFKAYCDANTPFIRNYWEQVGIYLGHPVIEPSIAHTSRAEQLMAEVSTQLSKALDVSSMPSTDMTTALKNVPIVHLAGMLRKQIKGDEQDDTKEVLIRIADYQLTLLENAIKIGYTPAAIHSAQLTLRNINDYCTAEDLEQESDLLPKKLLAQAESLTNQFGGVGALMGAYILSAIAQKLLNKLYLSKQANPDEYVLDTLAYTYLRNIEIYLRIAEAFSTNRLDSPEEKMMRKHTSMVIQAARRFLFENNHISKEGESLLELAIQDKSSEKITSLQKNQRQSRVFHDQASGAVRLTVSPEKNIFIQAHPLYQKQVAAFKQEKKATYAVESGNFLAAVLQNYTDKIYSRTPRLRGSIAFSLAANEGHLANGQRYLRIKILAKPMNQVAKDIIQKNFGTQLGEDGLAMYMAKYLAECFSWKEDKQGVHKPAFFQQDADGQIVVYVDASDGIHFAKVLEHFKTKDSVLMSKMDDACGLFGTANTTILRSGVAGSTIQDPRQLHAMVASQLLATEISSSSPHEMLVNAISTDISADSQARLLDEINEHHLAPLSPSHHEGVFSFPAITGEEPYIIYLIEVLKKAKIDFTEISAEQRMMNADLLACHLITNENGEDINPQGARVFNVSDHLFLELAYAVLFQQQVKNLKSNGQFPELESIDVELLPRERILKNHAHLRLSSDTTQHGYFVKINVKFNIADEKKPGIFDYFSKHAETEPFIATFKGIQAKNSNYCKENPTALWMQYHLRHEFYQNGEEKIPATDLEGLLKITPTSSAPTSTCLPSKAPAPHKGHTATTFKEKQNPANKK